MNLRFWKQNGLWWCGNPNVSDEAWGCSTSIRGAYAKWLKFSRLIAIGMISNAEVFPSIRMKNCSMLARVTQGLILHDRYLLKVDSRQPGGKG